MTENRNSYGGILKSIGLFGGVKIFQILVGIIKNKIVALLLGPTGMGISGMITTNANFINSLTGFGLHTSAVREIASATSSGEKDKISRVIAILRRLVWITGLLGFAVTFILAPQLSQWSFQSADYIWAFRLVSVILLLDQICIGQTVLMQGTFHYKLMAKSSLVGSVTGLIISVPIYYLLKFDGIVPVIIISSTISLACSTFYSRRVIIKKSTIGFIQAIKEGRAMLSLGFALALSGVVGIGSTYLLRLFISNYGSLADVGLYTAGITISTQYINVILTSMGSDYSPRLAALSNDDAAFNEAINKQTRLLLTLITPCVMLFAVFAYEITVLLYSLRFIAIVDMVEWMMIGMFFRASSWCLSYAVVAKGKSRVFLLNELLSCLCTLGFSVLGYCLDGFRGLGIAFCSTYVVYTLQMYVVCRRQFVFSYSKETLLTILMHMAPLVMMFIFIKFTNNYFRYIIGSLFFILEMCISYKQLTTMISFKSIINKIRKK